MPSKPSTAPIAIPIQSHAIICLRLGARLAQLCSADRAACPRPLRRWKTIRRRRRRTRGAGGVRED
eukprot:6995445-Pyramimonas_sp.AAC.1